MKKAARLSFRGGGRNRLDLQSRTAEGLKMETRRAKVVQVVDDPRMLARRHFNNGRNQKALTWSISLDNLPHKQLEKNPLRGRPAIQQDKSFIAHKYEVTIANHADESESSSLQGPPGNVGLGRVGFPL
jgi:hypothetical protein